MQELDHLHKIEAQIHHDLIRKKTFLEKEKPSLGEDVKKPRLVVAGELTKMIGLKSLHLTVNKHKKHKQFEQ
jgi:hypothetical protein